MQASLFPELRSDLPRGLLLSNPIVSPSDQAVLAERIDASGLTPFRFQQWTGKRLTRSYGWHYDFEGRGLTSAEAMPDWLLGVRKMACSALGEPAERYEQALLIRYDPGAGIGWHRDRPQFSTVIGVSLGSQVDLRLRRRTGDGFDRATVPLSAGAAYLLSGEARSEWEHSIVPVTRLRHSITFRALTGDAAIADR